MKSKEQIRFQFLKEKQEKYNINKAYKTINVSRSGYYKFLNHKPSNRDIENEVLSKEIKQIFEEHKGRYSSIRIAKVLDQKVIHINRKRASRLMRNMKLFPKGCCYRYNHYNQKVNAVEKPNLLNQVFQSSWLNKIWVGDITYIPTRKSTLYLAVFIDIYSRKVVGWYMNNRMKYTLVMDAFMQSCGKEHPEKGLIVHTDQESQFTGGRFQSLLKRYDSIHSESRKGNHYDNAVIKSFYKTIKRELFKMLITSHLNKLKRKSLNTLKFIITLKECILYWNISLHHNLKN